jgi:quercetin dioxygenase-like cupin family protein
VSATQRETIAVGAISVRFLVEPTQSGGSVSMFECTVPAGAAVPAPHSHDAFEESVYGLHGVVSFTIDGRAVDVGAGDAICIARGAVHGFANRGPDDAKWLAAASPGVFGPDYFRELGAVLSAADGGPPDREAIMAVMRRHGLTPAPPNTA